MLNLCLFSSRRLVTSCVQNAKFSNVLPFQIKMMVWNYFSKWGIQVLLW